MEFLAVSPGTGVVGGVESDSKSGMAEAEVRLVLALRRTAGCCQAERSSRLLK